MKRKYNKKVINKGWFKKGHTPWHKGKIGKCKSIGDARRGSKNPAWKGGITDSYRKLKNTPEWKEWRRKVFERDNYTCQDCGARSGNGKRIVLHPHHLWERSNYSKLMFKIWNGRTLCNNCHRKTIQREKEYRESLLKTSSEHRETLRRQPEASQPEMAVAAAETKRGGSEKEMR